MWLILREVLIQIVLAIVTDKATVEVGKRMILKGVDSAVEGVGITDDDAKHLLHSIASSTLNKVTHQDLGF